MLPIDFGVLGFKVQGLEIRVEKEGSDFRGWDYRLSSSDFLLEMKSFTSMLFS